VTLAVKYIKHIAGIQSVLLGNCYEAVWLLTAPDHTGPHRTTWSTAPDHLEHFQNY